MPVAAVAHQESEDHVNYGIDPARRAAARDQWKREGRSLRAWASQHGFEYKTAQGILYGDRKALRGKSHQIAVALGLKDGEVAND